jgi:hypothetical protein
MIFRCFQPIQFVRPVTLLALLFVLAASAFPAHPVQATTDLTVWQVTDGNQRFAISGTVDAVSYASNSIRINAGGQHVDILVTPTTIVEVHGESGSIGDIHKGSKISASGVVRDGQKIAQTIILK